MLERIFHLSERRTHWRTEVLAGLTTFVTMAYIIFVNPGILGSVPDVNKQFLPREAVLTATCLATGIMSLLMGLYANVPIALAPGMGLNAVVAYELVGQRGLSWPAAMGIIVVEGLVITLLVLLGIREAVMKIIPLSLKRAIAGGIGLFIAFIGLVEGGFVRSGQGTVVTLGLLRGWPIVVTIFGLVLIVVLLSRGIKGGLLIGVIGATLLAIGANAYSGWRAFPGDFARLPEQWVARPDFSTVGRFDLSAFAVLGLLQASLIAFSVMLSDFFDTMGTVIGVGEQAGLLDEEGNLPGLQRVLLIDSLSAMVGGMAGCSSVTSYIESSAGVAVGGRTGLTSVVVALCFFLAIFLNPLAKVVPKEATAPALIVVGFLMLTTIQGIRWEDWREGFPAFLTMMMMPFTYSITNGIAMGFLAYTLLEVLSGRYRSLHPLLWIVDIGFLIHFLMPVIQLYL